MSQTIIDLNGIKNKEQLLVKLGEVFEFGGPNGNHPASSESKSGWGMNWDALNDSLHYLDTGGIWGTSKKFEFPLKIVFENGQELQENDEESLRTLKEILEQKDRKFEVEFK